MKIKASELCKTAEITFTLCYYIGEHLSVLVYDKVSSINWWPLEVNIIILMHNDIADWELVIFTDSWNQTYTFCSPAYNGQMNRDCDKYKKFVSSTLQEYERVDFFVGSSGWNIEWCLNRVPLQIKFRWHTRCWHYWGFGLYQSSDILKTTTFWKLDLFLSSDEMVGASAMLAPLERANLNHWT
jgi:hypothetical protein